MLPEADLVESLVRKHRFAELALRLDLPVPVSRRLRPATEAPPERDLAFPAIVKPITRENAVWALAAGRAKAVPIETVEPLLDAPAEPQRARLLEGMTQAVAEKG